LRGLAASHEHARQLASKSRCWSRNSRDALNRILSIGYFDRLGVAVFHDLNFSNRPVRTRMPGGVRGVRSVMISHYPDFG
jgi:hypothetical protein